MPGYIVELGADVKCAHNAPAMPMTPNSRVLVDGKPTSILTTTFTVTGCPFNVSGSPVPCVTARWLRAATRVTSGGQPIVLLDSQANTQPNNVPLLITTTQTRVIAS